MTRQTRYSPEVRERAVRMVLEHQGEHASQWAAIGSIAAKIGCTARRCAAGFGRPSATRVCGRASTSDERERIKALEREIRELRQANEILRKASRVFCAGGARPPVQAMIAFIDDHRDVHGVEPICRVLPIAPSTYYEPRRPARRSREAAGPRASGTPSFASQIRRVWEENFQVYGVRKVWRQLRREGIEVARCTVARLMRAMGLQGVVRGKTVRTTISDKAAPCPLDRVNREFKAPAAERALGVRLHLRRHLGGLRLRRLRDRRLRPADRRLAGVPHRPRPASCSTRWSRRCTIGGPSRGGLVHHSDRGVQYVSINYTERLAEAGIEPSVGSVGDSYDNALAETIIGLYKTEVIRRRGPWRNLEAVEFATLEWVDWFNHRRLLEPIGNIPPAEAEAASTPSLRTRPGGVGLKQNSLRQTRRGSSGPMRAPLRPRMSAPPRWRPGSTITTPHDHTLP